MSVLRYGSQSLRRELSSRERVELRKQPAVSVKKDANEDVEGRTERGVGGVYVCE